MVDYSLTFLPLLAIRSIICLLLLRVAPYNCIRINLKSNPYVYRKIDE